MLWRNNHCVLRADDDFLSANRRLLPTEHTGLHDCVLGRMVPRLLGRSRSHADVGFAHHLRCLVSNELRRVVRTEHLLFVQRRLRDELRTVLPKLLDLLELLQLLSLLGFTVQHLCGLRTVAMQLVLNVHGWIRSVVLMWLVVRLQLV